MPGIIIPPTMTGPDLYGPLNPATPGRSWPADETATAGTPTSAQAGLASAGKSSAMVWVGLVLLLIALRIVVDLDE